MNGGGACRHPQLHAVQVIRANTLRGLPCGARTKDTWTRTPEAPSERKWRGMRHQFQSFLEASYSVVRAVTTWQSDLTPAPEFVLDPVLPVRVYVDVADPTAREGARITLVSPAMGPSSRSNHSPTAGTEVSSPPRTAEETSAPEGKRRKLTTDKKP